MKDKTKQEEAEITEKKKPNKQTERTKKKNKNE